MAKVDLNYELWLSPVDINLFRKTSTLALARRIQGLNLLNGEFNDAPALIDALTKHFVLGKIRHTKVEAGAGHFETYVLILNNREYSNGLALVNDLNVPVKYRTGTRNDCIENGLKKLLVPIKQDGLIPSTFRFYQESIRQGIDKRPFLLYGAKFKKPFK